MPPYLLWQYLFAGLMLVPTCLLAAEPDIAALRSAPIVIQTQKNKLVAEAFLWRDFMPGTPDHYSLMAAIKLKSIENLKLPSKIHINKVWLINGEKLWSTENIELHDFGSEKEIEIVTRNAPKWDVGSNVETIIMLTKKITGKASDHIFFAYQVKKYKQLPERA